MLRILLYLIMIIAAAVGVAWVASSPGAVTIYWRDMRIDMTAAFLLLVIALASIAISAIFLLTRFILKAPQHLRRRRQNIRYARGLQAVTQSLAALAAAETTRSKTLTQRARKYLGDAAITHLLEAQQARLENDETRIHQALEKMLQHRDTRALAARSLAEYNARHGNLPAAQKFAYQAKDQDPRNPKTYRTLFQVSLQSAQWQQAQQAIDKGLWQRAITRQTAKRWRTLLAMTRAEAFARSGDMTGALHDAERAFKQEPGFSPVALLYADLLIRNNNYALASGILRKAWTHTPHPHITDKIIAMASERPASVTLRIARKMAAAKTASSESAVLLSRAAMQAHDWKTAREALKQGITDHPFAPRLHAAYADLELQEFSDAEAASRWRLKAAQAGTEPCWTCGDCGHRSVQWELTCPICSSFDSFSWQNVSQQYQPPLI